MPTATVASKCVITELTLDITGRTIDIGERDDVPVTKLRLTYRDARVAAIVYDTIEDGEPSIASIHPDFIDNLDAWPDWVRELAAQHRPA